MIILFLSCFILNFHGTFLFSQISNLFICGIFEHNYFVEDKEIHYLIFFIINNKCRNQAPVIKTSDHLKTEHYQGLAGCCEGDLDSDLNRLASGNLWKYTTVPSHCERLTCTWTWRLLFFDSWYNFENHPGSVYSVTCKQLPLQQGAYLVHISVKQSILMRWDINIVIFYIIAKYNSVGIFADIVYLPTMILLFLLCFILNYHRTFIFIESIHLWYFRNTSILQQAEKSITFNFWSSATSAETNFLLSNQATTEIQITTGGWMISVREILTQT